MAVEAPPIIIKKIKKGGHGHHGGAWKVAFADFVTAMMAFFMLMWLLGSTTPEQKQAISHYMNNPLAESGPGGAGANIVLDGGDGILDGDGPSAFPQFAPSEVDVDDAEEIAAAAEAERMQDLKEELEAAIEANEALAPFKEQLLLDITSEGLRVQIVDKENRAMFAQGSPVLENYMREILREVGKVINEVPNRISISGHTDQTPYASSNGYSNWELSSDRANAARRELVSAGVPEEKIGRVVGLASSVLFDKENPHGPINRRISIIVMNKAAEDAVNSGEGRAEPEPDVVPAAPETGAPAGEESPGADAADADLTGAMTAAEALPGAGATATAAAPAMESASAAGIGAATSATSATPVAALPALPSAASQVGATAPPPLPATVTAAAAPPLPQAGAAAPPAAPAGATPRPPLTTPQPTVASPPALPDVALPAAPIAPSPAPAAPAAPIAPAAAGAPANPPAAPAPAPRPKKIVKIAIGS